MIAPSYRTLRPLLALTLAFPAACAAAMPAWAQEKRSGVDNSRCGSYRALAQHLYADFRERRPGSGRANGQGEDRLQSLFWIN